MRMEPVTVGICALVTMFGLGSFLNVKATSEVEQAVKETKPTVEQKIEQAVENQYITNNNYETHNHYEDDDSEQIKELEEKITKLEEEQKESDTGIISVGVNEYGVVYNTQHQPVKDPWRGPRSYKCNKAAGYPAICGYCGEQGEIHYNIKEWQDTQGTYHLTHVGCGQRYCNNIGVEPRIDEAYKIR